MKTFLILFCSIFFLFGCEHTTQVSSGRAYLSKHQTLAPVPASGGKGLSVEQAIRKAAAVEPTLRFPARIGLARVEGGQITDIPGVEAEAWQKLQGNLGASFGQLVPVSPLVADLVAGSAYAVTSTGRDRGWDTTSKIRLAASRQHLDAVIVYQPQKNQSGYTYYRAKKKKGSKADVLGQGSAILIDVLQAYPYATVAVQVTRGELQSTQPNQVGLGIKNHGLTNLFGRKEKRNPDLTSMQVTAEISNKLASEMERAIQNLRLQLAEKRAK
ncbi:hypothetical protein N9K16_01215 [Alphaproteobacteria bacterium]|nr:hypothetical protein [Alphaproteobacteria bacterium]